MCTNSSRIKLSYIQFCYDSVLRVSIFSRHDIYFNLGAGVFKSQNKCWHSAWSTLYVLTMTIEKAVVIYAHRKGANNDYIPGDVWTYPETRVSYPKAIYLKIEHSLKGDKQLTIVRRYNVSFNFHRTAFPFSDFSLNRVTNRLVNATIFGFDSVTIVPPPGTYCSNCKQWNLSVWNFTTSQTTINHIQNQHDIFTRQASIDSNRWFIERKI